MLSVSYALTTSLSQITQIILGCYETQKKQNYHAILQDCDNTEM